MKCPTCGHITWENRGRLGHKDVMIYETGSKTAFRCECGCNVFRRFNKAIKGMYTYQCNSCCMLYEGEK